MQGTNYTNTALSPRHITPDSPGVQQTSAHKRPDPQPPAQIREGWLSRLERIQYTGGAIETVLDAISKGDGLRGTPVAVQSVFNSLIRHEEYGVFVEVFNAWCECSGKDGEPIKASLDLGLPHDWKPSRPAEMVEAFGRIKVHQVRVSSSSDSTAFHPIPEAVCMCVAVMVGLGTGELHVFGELAAPGVITDVFGHSQLQAIHFHGSAGKHEPLPASEIASFASLAQGLVRCAKLEHLEIHHGDLLALQPTGETFSRIATTTTTTTTPTTTTATIGTTVTQALPVAANPLIFANSGGAGSGQGRPMFLKLSSGKTAAVWHSGKEKMQDFFDFLRLKYEISNEKKISIIVMGKVAYSDPGKDGQNLQILPSSGKNVAADNVNSVDTIGDFEVRYKLNQVGTIHVVLSSF